jgi:hypothetical protein
MKNLPRTTGRFIALITTAFLLSACESVFDHNVSGNPVAIDPFLGRWTLVELLGAAPSSATIVQVEEDADGELIVRVTDTSGTTEVQAALTSLGGATILSIKNRDGSWQISKVSLAEEDQRLVVQLPDFGTLRNDVLAGVIAGEVRQTDLDEDDLVIISADTTSLSGYLAAKLSLFQGTAAILERSGPV